MSGVSQVHLRQQLLPWLGPEGQARLAASHALVAGCGALGGVLVEWLARAGVGQLTLVDRDVVEPGNLHRQVLFTSEDARRGVPKAEAAARRVRDIAPQARLHACVEHLGPENAADLARGTDVLVDGLDNMETRLVLNDLSVREAVPYVHAAAVAMQARCMPVMPGGACLRCLMPEVPGPGVLETCDTAGVLGPVVGLAASWAAVQVLRLLAGRADLVDRRLWSMDLAADRVTAVSIPPDPDCPCCGQRRFDFLERQGERVVNLCGRGAVQVLPPGGGGRGVDLPALAARLAAHGAFRMEGDRLVGSLQASADGQPLELTVFADGRAIVGRCTDRDVARGVYDRFIGG
jgi:molybdopterin/thiamine biosynthesis adenylyltransferase